MIIKSKYLYLFIYLIFSLSLIAVLYKPIMNSFLDDDVFWTLAAISQNTAGKGFVGTLFYLFSLKTLGLEIGFQNFFIYILYKLFGMQPESFIVSLLFIHFACSLLLFLLLRKLNLEFKVSFYSALTYLVLFAHYVAYILPINSHHILVVFFLLLILNLYLKTTQRIEQNQPYLFYYLLTLFLNLMASLNNAPIVIVPFLILILILVSAKDKLDRLKKFDLWLPLFATYLFYVPLRLAFGHTRLDNKVWLGALKTQPIMHKFLILFLPAVLFLLIIRIILKLLVKYNLKKASLKRIIWAAIITIGLGMGINYTLFTSGSVNIIKLLTAPYKVLFLFAGLQNTFLYPLKTWIDTAHRWAYINLNLSPLSILLAVLLIAITIRKAIRSKNKELIIFLFWYLLCLINPEGRPGLKYTVIPTRYFIFISPIFSFVFCMAIIEIYDYIAGKLKLKIKAKAKELILIIFFTPFFFANIAEIRVIIFQNRLANSFLIYDYIRMAENIKCDIKNRTSLKNFNTADIYLADVKAIPYAKMWQRLLGFDPFRHDVLRQVFVAAFNNQALFDINVNQPPAQNKNALYYKIGNFFILDSDGINIDPFYQLYGKGTESLRLERYNEAMDFFQEAAKARTFTLNFMLGRLPVEDLHWILEGQDFSAWANQIAQSHDFYEICKKDRSKKYGDEKLGYNASIINRDFEDYMTCLFCLSYLEYLNQNIEKSHLLLSKINSLDNNFFKQQVWKRQLIIPVKLERQMQLFLEENKSNISIKSAQAGKVQYFKFLFNLLKNEDYIRYCQNNG